MKKVISILAALAVLFACNPVEPNTPDKPDDKPDAEDDVARVKLGGNWRMPTEEEWMALKTKCKWEWKVLDGVFGHLVTATNGNRLFLPAAGYMNVTTLDLAGSYGYYWSTSLSTTRSRYAKAFYFLVSNVTMYDAFRSYGCPVRAVTE